MPLFLIGIIGLVNMAGILPKEALIVAFYISGYLVWGALVFGVYPVFIKTETLFRKRGYTNVAYEYRLLKRFLIIIIPLLIITNSLPYYFHSLVSPIYAFMSVIMIIVTLGGVLRFVTQVGKKEYRFYFAKACCKVMSETEEDSEKIKYLGILLESYNKYLQRNLKIAISDLSGIYSIILCKDIEERNLIINAICNSLEYDKLNLARYLSSLFKVADSTFYIKESLFQQLKVPGTILVTAIPIIISIIQVVTNLYYKQP